MDGVPLLEQWREDSRPRRKGARGKGTREQEEEVVKRLEEWIVSRKLRKVVRKIERTEDGWLRFEYLGERKEN